MSNATISNRVHTEGASQTAGVLAKIDTVVGEISGILDQVAALNAALRELQAQKPELGDLEGLSDEQKQAKRNEFNQKMSEWNQLVASYQGQISQAYDRLEQAQQKLTALNNNELPAAKRRDAEELERRAAQEKEKLESTVKEFDNRDEDLNSTSAVVRAEIRAREINGRTVLEVTTPSSGFAANNAFGIGGQTPLAGGTGLPSGEP